MATGTKRVTVYFDSELHRALRLKAAETDRSVSDLVNEAVKLALAEDAEDLAAFEERVHEPELPFESVVKDLKDSTHPDFIVDEENNRKAVILPYSEWQKIVEQLEELDDIRAYDRAKARDEEVVPFEEAVAEIRRES